MKAYFFQNPKQFWSYHKAFLYLWAKPNSTITYTSRLRYQLKKRMFLILIIIFFISLYLISVLSQQHKPVMQMHDVLPDWNIPPCLLQERRKQIAPSFCWGFISPSELLASPLNGKKKNVTPVHIKDSMEQTENNRPISLLCIISKDLESCVRITLNNYVKQFTSMTFCEIGFCTTQLLSILMPLVKTWKNIQTDIIYLDLAKAFDSIDH